MPRVYIRATVCPKCGEPRDAERDHGNFCTKHHRLYQMRNSSRHRGLYCPTEEEIESMLPPDMKCGDCSETMVWTSKEDRRRVATIQHYRDGSLGIVCRSCNSRHVWMEGDSFREIPKDHRYCKVCDTVKPLTEFGTPAPSSKGISRSWCRPCSTLKDREYRMRKIQNDQSV